jgi:hypothetical protein
MKKKYNLSSSDNKNKSLDLDKEKIGIFFLGVGIIMFILNIVSFLQLLPIIIYMNSIIGTFPMHGFYISIISSVILITYSLYNIYVK